MRWGMICGPVRSKIDNRRCIINDLKIDLRPLRRVAEHDRMSERSRKTDTGVRDLLGMK